MKPSLHPTVNTDRKNYIREMRQLFPSASIRDVLNMKVRVIWPDYVQEIRQIYPSASVRDVIDLKVQAILPDIRARDPTNLSVRLNQ
jgi:hypothetical protein